MKILVQIVLALIISLQPLGGMLAQIAFKVNQNYIERTMCVNRFKPKLNCKGKCFLSRQLKKAAEQQNNQAKQNREQPQVLHFLDITIVSTSENPFNSNMGTLPPISYSYRDSQFVTDIFHPPRG